MSYRAGMALVVSLWPALSGPLAAQEAVVLQIRVLDGDGAVHAAGTRSGRPLTVRVTDETGKPVSHAAVSFRLPESGPSGVFASGMKTEVGVTAADGRASTWGIQWNRVTGPVEVRITAVKGAGRAGIVVAQYLSDKVSGKPPRDAPASLVGRTRGRVFYAVVLVVAGAAAGGAAVGLSRYSQSAQPAAAADAVTAPPTQVGVPVISVGRP